MLVKSQGKHLNPIKLGVHTKQLEFRHVVAPNSLLLLSFYRKFLWCYTLIKIVKDSITLLSLA